MPWTNDVVFSPRGDVVASGYDVLTSLRGILDRVDAIIGQVETGQGSIGKLISDDALYTNLNQTVEEARKFTQALNEGGGTIGLLLHDPSVVLLDEPFTGLDPRASDRLEELLHLLRDGRRTVVMTIHDLERGWAMCDRALVLARGKIVYEAKSPPGN